MSEKSKKTKVNIYFIDKAVRLCNTDLGEYVSEELFGVRVIHKNMSWLFPWNRIECVEIEMEGGDE